MVASDPEKSGPIEVEVASNHEAHVTAPKGDYSGAVAKTDQVEIALVKKLDRRVLPILWAMYFLYADQTAPVSTVLTVSQELP